MGLSQKRQPLFLGVRDVWTVAPMTAADAAAVAALERACFAHPWSEDAVAAELTNPAAVFLVAKTASGEIGGYVGMLCAADEGAITNVAVSPHCRRKGCADALLTALCARAAGLCRIALEVRVSNIAAIALYEKHGFSKVGVRPRFYRTPTEDAYIMMRERRVEDVHTGN